MKNETRSIAGVNPVESKNFHCLKTVAMLMVLAGHYFNNVFPWIWLPVGLAVGVFASTSSYFMFRIYGEIHDFWDYWKRKWARLAATLFVVDLFLVLVFVAQRRGGIWTWHTLINSVGLNGVLNWARIHNRSPLGAGMWFFTLLLIFYIVYPLLVRLYRHKISCVFITMLLLSAGYYLHIHVVYGHLLWFASSAFVIGLFLARMGTHLSLLGSSAGIGLTTITFAVANYLSFRSVNFVLLLIMLVFTMELWRQVPIPDTVAGILTQFRSCLLEAYLIHTSMYVHPTGYLAIDFVASLVTILFVARLLAYLAECVRKACKRAVARKGENGGKGRVSGLLGHGSGN